MLFQLFSYITGGERRKKAKALAAGEDPDGDAATLDVLAAIEKFPGVRPDPEAFIEALDPLQPRLYSISSSPKVHQRPRVAHRRRRALRHRQAHAARRRLDLPRRPHRRPATRSRSMCRRRTRFGLPADPSVPIIMIGPGTGVAPFRAFLHERMATKAPGRNWLFFGHQQRDCDFFYEDELTGMKAAGVLTRLSLAWSRDGEEKFYVQDRMRRGRPRSLVVDRRRRAHLRLRRRAAHGEGRRARAGRYRRGARRALDQRGDRLRRRPEEEPAATRRTCIDERARQRRRQPSAPPAPIAASAAACWRGPTANGGAIITGDPDHPANFGRLCSKGFALDETLGLDGRLLHPMLRQADGTLRARRLGHGARHRRRRLPPHRRARRAGRRRVLSLRPAC